MSLAWRALPGMDATWSRPGNGNAWDAAVDLANGSSKAMGCRASRVPCCLMAARCFTAITAEGWRFHGVDVTCEAPRAVAIGGPLMFGLAAAGSAAVRGRARREAEALAAPQWRPLGVLRILAIDRRLLVWHEGAWVSVWYHATENFIPTSRRRGST